MTRVSPGWCYVSVERAVFECLEDSDADLDGYDALEDDFILLANEGKIAVKAGNDGNDEE